MYSSACGQISRRHQLTCCRMDGLNGIFPQKNYLSRQVELAVSWFPRWNEIHQAEALIRMFTSISPIQAKFIMSIILEDGFKVINYTISEEESAANDPEYMKRLMTGCGEAVFEKLLTYLPLLKTENEAAKTVYKTYLPYVFRYCIERCIKINEARKLFTLCLIHPALKDSRKDFEFFKYKLFNDVVKPGTSSRMAVIPVMASPSNVAKPLTFSDAVQDPLDDKFKLRQNNYSKPRQMPKCINNGQTPTATTGFDYNPSNLQPSTNPGMKDLYSWLKFLRLHKYYNHLLGLTYEQVMSLDEENFDEMVPGVTRGARGKFLLTINALRERHNTLLGIEVNAMTMSSEKLLESIDIMKKMLFAPMKAASPHQKETKDDIPHYFFRALKAIFRRVVTNDMKEEDCVKRLRTLIFIAMKNEALSSYSIPLATLKNRLYSFENYSANLSMYLGTSPRPIQSSQHNPVLVSNQPRALPAMNPLFINIPSQQNNDSAFERVNHPQFNSERVDDIDGQTGESISCLSLAVGSNAATRSQRNSASTDLASKSTEQTSSRSNSFNSNENASNVDRVPENNGTIDGICQKISGLSLNGESVGEYKLFFQDEYLINTDEDNNKYCSDDNNNSWQTSASKSWAFQMDHLP